MMNAVARRFGVASWPYSTQRERDEVMRRIRREWFFRAGYTALMTTLATASLLVLSVVLTY
jgi:hypothetical protein